MSTWPDTDVWPSWHGWDVVTQPTPTRRDPQRQDSVRIELLDQHGNILGQVHPARGRVPTIEVDTSATIPRRLTGVRLDPDEAEQIDVYSHRLRPVWTQAGVDYPMGLFVWSTADKQRDGWGVSLTSGTLHDLTMALHQPLTESFAADEGATITDRLVALIERYGIVDHSISPSDQTTSSPLSWAAGKPGSKVLDALTSKLSYVWWFDRDGLLRAELEPDPDVHAPQHWYEEAHVAPGVGENQDPFMTPNTWLVLNESAEGSEVVGRYRLPQTNRASAEQRGFDVVEVVKESGISSTAQADKRARQAADESQTTTEVTITVPPNPGIDMHDLAAWRGTTHRIIKSSVALDPAADNWQDLTLRRRDDAL